MTEKTENSAIDIFREECCPQCDRHLYFISSGKKTETWFCSSCKRFFKISTPLIFAPHDGEIVK